MSIPSRDGYAFGRKLLSMMFSNEELSTSLVYKSKKSSKPALDKEKVRKLLLLYIALYIKGEQNL